MVELGTRVLIDAGAARARAVPLVVGAAVVCGLPSAVSLAVFENQDWVWGLALMVSGLFIAVATLRYGVDRFRDDLVNTHSVGRRAGPVWAWILKYLVPVEFAVMFGWWMYQAATVYDPDGWWNPPAGVQRRHLRGAVGYCAGRAVGLQPPPSPTEARRTMLRLSVDETSRASFGCA